MTHLYIDNVLVDLPTDFKFTLIKENPYFTKSSSYSLDVTLSTESVTNSKVFGHLSRRDVTKLPSTWQCRLVVDNRNILIGTATLTEVNERTVTIQLLGGNSEMNFLSKVEKLYIDELDLGPISEDWTRNEDGTFLFSHGTSSFLGEDFFNISRNFIVAETYSIHKIKNTTEDCFYNVFKSTSSGSQLLMDKVALQPRLWYVIDRLFSFFGYSVDVSDIDCDLYRNILCMNASPVVDIKDVLPHWTVTEFIEQLEHLFNCTIILDDLNKRATFISYNSYVNQTSLFNITDVSDEYSAETDDESDDELPNVGFNLSYSDFGPDFLGDEFRDFIIDITDFEDKSKEFLVSKYGSSKIFYNKNAEYDHMFCIGPFQETPNPNGSGYRSLSLDLYGRIDPMRDSTFQLDIKPVEMYNLNDPSYSAFYPTMPGREFSETENVYELISNWDTPAEPEHLTELRIALDLHVIISYPSKTYTYRNCYTAEDEDGEIVEFALLFRPKRTSKREIVTLSIYHDVKTLIKKDVLYEISFTDERHLDPSFLYIINNKKYACLKLEYELSSLGFEKIKKGFFYRIP